MSSEVFTPPPSDPLAAVTHTDPYGYYACLRAGPALQWDARLGLWVASRAEVVFTLLAHGALRVRPLSEPVPAAIVGRPAGELFGHLVRMNDGPAHAAWRPTLQRALAGLDLDAAHARALRLSDGLLQDTRTPLADLLFEIPLRAVAQLLGFADAALPQAAAWTRDFVACLSPLSSAAQLEAASAAAGQLLERLEAIVGAVPARGASLLAAVQADAGAAGPSLRALLANLAGLLSQTCDATAGLLGNSLVAVARDPALHALAATHDGVRAIVRETARHDPSVQNTRRYAAATFTLEGTTVEAGQAVLLLLAAASRDPALHPAPDAFLPRREAGRMPGFGHGAHACPGEALACTLAAAGLQALLQARGAQVDALCARGWSYRPSVNARIPLFR